MIGRGASKFLMAMFLYACSGDVTVHGVPDQIELVGAPCVPAPADAGAE